MPADRRLSIRAAEIGLALGYLLVWALVRIDVASPPFDVLPDGTVTLALPGVLAAAVLVGVVEDGPGIGALFLGGLAALTLLVATWSVVGLYASDGGGVFFGSLLTLLVAGPLSVAVVGRDAWWFVAARKQWGREGTSRGS